MPAGRQVELPPERYFKCGDVEDLKEKMELLLEKGISEQERRHVRRQLEDKYNWDRIAEQTIAVYEKAGKRGGLKAGRLGSWKAGKLEGLKAMRRESCRV